jgi:pSer/pThr/pTyr-binding forkhead associated (FHA) protein
MKVQLISAGREIVLNDLPAIIGRSDTADICLNDTDTGEFQCIIEQDEGRLSVADIAGGLGTFVNGDSITNTVLMPGDRLTVGRSNFTVQYELRHPLPATFFTFPACEDSKWPRKAR